MVGLHTIPDNRLGLNAFASMHLCGKIAAGRKEKKRPKIEQMRVGLFWGK